MENQAADNQEIITTLTEIRNELQNIYGLMYKFVTPNPPPGVNFPAPPVGTLTNAPAGSGAK